MDLSSVNTSNKLFKPHEIHDDSDIKLLLASQESSPFKPLSMKQKLSFGLGHVINDVLSALWFSYTLIFLQEVAGLEPTAAANLLFLGQVIDALATPIVGTLLDRFGTRKMWHLAGVLMTSVSFSFIFQVWNAPIEQTILYYAIAIIIFQVGWAIVQLSQLSLIPELTPCLKERAKLTTIRYVVSMCSNIIIYIIAYISFYADDRTFSNLISPQDASKFKVVTIFATCIGVLCAIIFQWTLVTDVRIGRLMDGEGRITTISQSVLRKIFLFCRNLRLYQIALVHTSSRLFNSLVLVYTPFFLNETKLNQPAILALCPFICFLGSLFGSVLFRYLCQYQNWNYKVLFTIGTAICILGCVCLLINNEKLNFTLDVYVSSLLFGVGSSLTIITSLCIAANLIGSDIQCSGFAYSIITFFDKILSGFGILIIEYLKCSDPSLCSHYYKFILSVVNGSLLSIGCLLVLSVPNTLCLSGINN